MGLYCLPWPSPSNSLLMYFPCTFMTSRSWCSATQLEDPYPGWMSLLHDAVFWKCTLINKLVRSHQPPRNRLILANIEGELGIAIHDRFLHCCVFLLALEKMWKRQGQGGSAQLDVPTDRQSREIAEDRVTKFWLTKARHSSTLFFW